ncbi:hypothetical protein J7L27_04895, partial [Candidatus Bathyarchaeota archaeon]|nr:hypothetical protein [Candidatus Bathyarchaeota archaeon]
MLIHGGLQMFQPRVVSSWGSESNSRRFIITKIILQIPTFKLSKFKISEDKFAYSAKEIFPHRVQAKLPS